jgi:hypothetical protein
MRGEAVFRTFYRNRSVPEQFAIQAIGEELRTLMDKAEGLAKD